MPGWNVRAALLYLIMRVIMMEAVVAAKAPSPRPSAVPSPQPSPAPSPVPTTKGDGKGNDSSLTETSKAVGIELFAGMLSTALIFCVGDAWRRCKGKRKSNAEQMEQRLRALERRRSAHMHMDIGLGLPPRAQADITLMQHEIALQKQKNQRPGQNPLGHTKGKRRSNRRVQHLRSKAPKALTIDISGAPAARRMSKGHLGLLRTPSGRDGFGDEVFERMKQDVDPRRWQSIGSAHEQHMDVKRDKWHNDGPAFFNEKDKIEAMGGKVGGRRRAKHEQEAAAEAHRALELHEVQRRLTSKARKKKGVVAKKGKSRRNKRGPRRKLRKVRKLKGSTKGGKLGLLGITKLSTWANRAKRNVAQKRRGTVSASDFTPRLKLRQPTDRGGKNRRDAGFRPKLQRARSGTLRGKDLEAAEELRRMARISRL